MTKSTYARAVEDIKAAYEPRILVLLTKIREALVADGLEVSEPYELTDDEYQWDLAVNGLLSISVTILESLAREGTVDGVSFMVDIVGVGGEMIGGLAPFNYSPELWVKVTDENAVERRFELIEAADVTDIVPLVQGFLRAKARYV